MPSSRVILGWCRARSIPLLLGSALLLAACGAGTDAGTATPSATAAALQAQIVASEVLVGSQRFPVGILDQNTPVNDATVHVRAYLVNGTVAQLKSESDAPFRGAQLEGKGLYVAHLNFDAAGNWGRRDHGARTRWRACRHETAVHGRCERDSPGAGTIGAAKP